MWSWEMSVFNTIFLLFSQSLVVENGFGFLVLTVHVHDIAVHLACNHWTVQQLQKLSWCCLLFSYIIGYIMSHPTHPQTTNKKKQELGKKEKKKQII